MSFAKRLDVFSILAFILPLAVYIQTLAPSVTFFDSGEFITAIACQGSAHSPGYPLFLNYAKPFTWLPFASVAFKVNFATAVSGAMACFGAYMLTVYLLKDEMPTDDERFNTILIKVAALAAALVFAFSPRLWLQSNHDKPYPLVTFIVAVILYMIFRWRDSYREGAERPAFIYMSAFLCGLATGAHQTIILMIPSFAFLIISMNWRIVFRLRDFIVAFMFGILGFAINLHLPIRATRMPILNWANPQTKEQFLWHFLRKGYPSEKVDRGWSLLWSQLNAFNIPHEFTNIGLAIMLFGLITIAIKKRAEVMSYLLAVITFLAVIAGYFNANEEFIFLTEEFFTPLYLFSAVFLGVGLFSMAGYICRVTSGKLGESLRKAVIILLLLLLPSTVCSLNYVKNDQHLNYVAYDYASSVLRSAQQGAILYTWGDSGAFPLWYLQGIERMREDLDILHTPHLVFDWYLDGFPRLFNNSVLRTIPLETLAPENVLLMSVNEQYNNRPILIDYSTRFSVPFGNYRFLQRGVTYQLIADKSPIKSSPDMSVWGLYSVRGFMGNEMFFRDLDTGKAILIYANSRLESGEALLNEGRLGEGIENLKIAALIAPELSPEIYRTLARYGVR